ncbi:plasmid segregation protein ParM [Desulfohalotomaculum tongense]|uniref:ParM/StbA family protein n=1 Tax=Desulforadius tongensis TaxID=1216062 RepID=UPI00195D824A|nr:ParM/StbA family protein [Desulforadius tongensis]MBM7854926.1 plasmid segregation protein ParM [Desulforadius tongensis]
MQAIAIDVGYSHVKAVSPDHRIIIPSVVAPYRELTLADMSEGVGHTVEIRQVNGTKTKHFVGELAVREGRGATFTLDRHKHRHPNHDILILTSARLLNIQPGAILGVGLPVAYYRSQREELSKHLMSLHAEVKVDNGSFNRVSFGRVVVYPQGAGALLTAPDLPSDGLVLLVDVGYKTTDFVVAEIAGGIARPVSSLCGSIETGVHTVHEAISAEYQTRTGTPLAAVDVHQLINNKGKIFFYGNEIDLSDALKKIKDAVAVNIIDQVMARLGDRAAFVRRAYLAGGGADALPALKNIFPVTQILPDPQWANAKGFLSVVRRLETA